MGHTPPTMKIQQRGKVSFFRPSNVPTTYIVENLKKEILKILN